MKKSIVMNKLLNKTTASISSEADERACSPQMTIPERIRMLESEIASLPAGYISRKTIRGKVKQYLQWNEDGKKKSKYLNDEAAAVISEQIEKRRELERQLRVAKATLPRKLAYPKTFESLLPGASTEWPSYSIEPSVGVAVAEKPYGYSASAPPELRNSILFGAVLQDFIMPASSFRKRNCFGKLKAYISGSTIDKVLIMYGLRRTGKTTLIKQAILEMTREDFDRTALIQMSHGKSLKDLNSDLKLLAAHGYRTIFIDEVTLADDFIDGAALLSDIYAASGLKIILSGTDSLGFMLSRSDQLFDRCIMVHTTWIPYREFNALLGISGIDNYIQYGGTMSMSGEHYNEESPFVTLESTDEYIDNAISKNIQHSLRYYQDGGHFRHLEELYSKDELTSAINRVVEDINHRFTIDVLTRDFISHDLGISARNLRNDRNEPNDILDQIDSESFTERLRHSLEILNKPEQSVEITDAHRIEIKEYLDLLDLTADIPTESIPAAGDAISRTAITQPGLRYAQAKALIHELFKDAIFQDLSLPERTALIDRILNEIKGRMMEDIVLLETMKAYPGKGVFRLQFAAGEFDMVITDPATLTCEIYEIKHSTESIPEQFRHLMDTEKCDAAAFQYGTITRKAVIYRGETMSEREVEYINIEEYLKNLPHDTSI